MVPVNRIKQKCFQITTKRVHWSQQFQLRRQPVPCSRCINREGSVANSSTCRRHDDDVATRWSAQCRSTWNINNRCQKVWDIIPARVRNKLNKVRKVDGWMLMEFDNEMNTETNYRLYVKLSLCWCYQSAVEEEYLKREKSRRWSKTKSRILNDALYRK